MTFLPAERAPNIATLGDADVAAWLAAVGTVGAAQQSYVTALVQTLKGAGIWASLDRLWLFAAENATQALTDLVARAAATPVASPTFTANRGYKGSHLSAYLSSGFNPSTAGGHYTRNDATFGCWIETAESAPASGYRLMGNDSANYSEISTGATVLAAPINQGAGQATTISSTATGLVMASRSASNAHARYLNGTLDGAAAVASIALPNNNFNILAGNNAGTAYQQSDARAAAAVIGGNLNGTQQSALYAAMRAYMTSGGVA